MAGLIDQGGAALEGARPARPRAAQKGAWRGTDVRVARSLVEMDGWESAWEKIPAGRGNPVVHFAYARAWAAGLAAGERLHVLTAGGEQAAAIAPLIRNTAGAGRLHLLADDTYEIFDFAYADAGAVYELARAIARTGWPLHFRRVPAESAVIEAIRAAYRGRGPVFCRRQAGSPWIPLDSSWTEPESHLNSGRRSDLRRARRLAEKTGAVEFEIGAPAPERVPELLAEAFRVEAAGWKGAAGTALASDPVRGPFFARYAERASAAGILRMCFLRIGGRAVAAQIAVESGDTLSLLRAGYDESYSRCSPGTLLTSESIRYAARRGLGCFEFNGVTEPWTAMWTEQERACCSLRAYPLWSWRGIAALTADGWQAAARRIRKRGEAAR